MDLHRRKTRLAFLMACFMFMVFATSTFAEAATVRNSDKTSASSGTAIVGVSGSYDKVNTLTLLARINAIRKEACKEGVWCRQLNRKLTSGDYVPITWDSTLEYIAQIRAAEADVYMSHNRPNGTSTFTMSYNGKTAREWADHIIGIASGNLPEEEKEYLDHVRAFRSNGKEKTDGQRYA